MIIVTSMSARRQRFLAVDEISTIRENDTPMRGSIDAGMLKGMRHTRHVLEVDEHLGLQRGAFA